jgi:hypothetical protein
MGECSTFTLVLPRAGGLTAPATPTPTVTASGAVR